MNNQAGGPCSIFGDIFSIREKVINDILLQNNLDKIRQRQVERTSSAKKKPKRKSKQKNNKISDLILPKINLTNNANPNQINYNISQNNNYSNNNLNTSSVLNSNPNRNLIAQIKNNISNNNNSSSGLFLTNLNSASNNNPFKNNVQIINNICNTIPTNEGTNSVKPRSVISEGNQFKFLFSYDDPNRELFLKRFLESKKRSNFNKLLEIEKENEYFIKRLKSVNSNLSRDKLNSAYARACEYKNLAKKAKTNKEIKDRIDNKVIAHLPPIILNRFASLGKFDVSLNNSRVVSNTYEG